MLNPPFGTHIASGSCPISFGKKLKPVLHPAIVNPIFLHSGVALVWITHIALVPVGQEIARVFRSQLGSMTLPPLELLLEDELDELLLEDELDELLLEDELDELLLEDELDELLLEDELDELLLEDELDELLEEPFGH